MSIPITFISVGITIILVISAFKWRMSKQLLNTLDKSDFKLYTNKTVSGSARLKLGETIGIPIKCTLALNKNELHLIPLRFSPLLFMTDFPYSFRKVNNRKLKIQNSRESGLVFMGQKSNPSIAGSLCEITISVYDEERDELLKVLKKW